MNRTYAQLAAMALFPAEQVDTICAEAIALAPPGDAGPSTKRQRGFPRGLNASDQSFDQTSDVEVEGIVLSLQGRILGTPGLIKLSGEQREVTVLFTDVEGFTAMMHDADPGIIVATLDNYFEGMATIIGAHGGIIGEIAGDAVHALFNAPNDLEDHPRKAIDCACAPPMVGDLLLSPEVAPLGFRRTRIGLETGRAIGGEVCIVPSLTLQPMATP
jgi:hypothetical protein